jgi:phosphate starvation-inducible protein PhoH and related proteins
LARNKKIKLREKAARQEEIFGLAKRKPVEIVVSAKTEGQKRYIIEVKNHDITICMGPAGSGKTAVAVGLALEAILAKNPSYEKLIVMRPAKEACGEKIGFLPGDLSEKMGPWAAPVVDNMLVWVDQNTVKNMFHDKKVDIIPLAYARGRSLNNAFIILDEAQNCSKEQMLMALTRLGSNSKLVINGDINQSDIGNVISGLEDAANRLQNMDRISIVEMDESDIVRNPLIGKILQRYSDGPSNSGPIV